MAAESGCTSWVYFLCTAWTRAGETDSERHTGGPRRVIGEAYLCAAHCWPGRVGLPAQLAWNLSAEMAAAEAG
jgi:hypothetical protein